MGKLWKNTELRNSGYVAKCLMTSGNDGMRMWCHSGKLVYRVPQDTTAYVYTASPQITLRVNAFFSVGNRVKYVVKNT